MTQEERLDALLALLLQERPEYAALPLPESPGDKRRLFRSLVNVRPPEPVSERFLALQDAFLQEETRRKGVTGLRDLTPVGPGLYLWQGDITTLRCDAIVNAANSRLLGCFVPCHGCIDNAIHTFAGVQLRLDCAGQMRRQGHGEPTGRAKITKAYNLPCRYVLHTVGPVIRGAVTARDRAALASCYRACLDLAAENGLRSVAFCCISTGEFRFPPQQAAGVALAAVRTWRQTHSSSIEVIFNVFKDSDLQIYRRALGLG